MPIQSDVQCSWRGPAAWALTSWLRSGDRCSVWWPSLGEGTLPGRWQTGSMLRPA
ncbi:hypothetical protein [Ornithinimicrobium kibberense]|uniref:hypothetical protein n=1 Tax=Ornithinimicrobium kibberense TaxID=282060 RepID=UPI003614C742